MQHGIIGTIGVGHHRVEPARRARIASIALGVVGVVGVVGGCSGETTGTSAAGGPNVSTASGGGTGAQCAIGVRDVLVSTGAGSGPAVAFGGDHYLVAWTSTVKDAGDIRIALLDAKGAKVTEQPLAEGPGVASFASIVAEADGFLVVWQELAASGAVVYGRRVDPMGMPKGAAFSIAKSGSVDARPSVAKATMGTAVAWADTTTSTLALINGQMLSNKTPIDQGTGPAIGGAGAALGIAWVAGSKLGASMMTSPGAPLSPVMFREAVGKANAPRVAVHDDGTLSVVWEDNRAGDDHEVVYRVRIDKSAQAGKEMMISMGNDSANYPDVAWTGTHDAIVYYQFRGGPPAVYLSLIAPDATTAVQDLKISADGLAARFPRIVRTGDSAGTLGVVFAEKGGPIHASLVTCP
jgi:hypothetical protein